MTALQQRCASLEEEARVAGERSGALAAELALTQERERQVRSAGLTQKRSAKELAAKPGTSPKQCWKGTRCGWEQEETPAGRAERILLERTRPLSHGRKPDDNQRLRERRSHPHSPQGAAKIEALLREVATLQRAAGPDEGFLRQRLADATSRADAAEAAARDAAAARQAAEALASDRARAAEAEVARAREAAARAASELAQARDDLSQAAEREREVRMYRMKGRLFRSSSLTSQGLPPLGSLLWLEEESGALNQ